MLNNQNLYTFLANILICLAPITGFPFFKQIFRESSGEGLLYIVILITPIFLLQIVNGTFIIIKPIKILFCLFSLSLFLILFKFSHLELVFLQRSGLSRYTTQMMTFAFTLYSMLVISNIILHISLQKLLSILITGLYIQVFIIYIQVIVYVVDIDFLNQFYSTCLSIFVDKSHLLNELGRPHGLSKEPSHLAIYLLISWPIFLMKNRLLSVKGVVIIIAFVSLLSRSLIIILFIQSIAFFISKSKGSEKIYNYLKLLMVLLLVIFFFGDFILSAVDIEKSGSTFTRFVAAYSAFMVFLDFPLSGVGFGLTSFFSINYFEEFGIISNEILEVVKGERLPFIHIMHIRILSDLGLLGFLIWSWFIINQVRLHRRINNSSIYKPVIYSFGIIFPLIFFTKENIAFMNIWLFTVVHYIIFIKTKKTQTLG